MADYWEQASDLVKGGVRGATSDLVGAPVDIINLLLKAVDATKVLPQRFGTEEPVMGSNWIHRRLKDAGMAWQESNSPTEHMGRVLGSFSVTPGTVGKVGSAVEDFAKARAEYYAGIDPFVARAVKEPGGMWHPEAVERLGEPLKGSLLRGREDMMPAPGLEIRGEVPEYDWADRAVRNYLNKYAGTSRDPLKDVEVPFGEGTKRWEELTDQAITGKKLFDFAKDPYINSEKADFTRNYPGSKAGEIIWGIEKGRINAETAQAKNAIESYLSHVGDYLRQNVPPARLAQYDLTRAVKETAANDARVAKEMEKASLASTKDLPVHKDYGDGFRWVELRKPEKLTEGQAKLIRPATLKETRSGIEAQGPDMDYISGNTHQGYGYVAQDSKGNPIRNSYTESIAWGKTPEEASLAGQLAQEGNQMGHCVGGYCSEVASGESKIYSLRDAKGRSHVTIEVGSAAATKPMQEEFFAQAPKDFQDRYNPIRGSKTEWIEAISDSPEYAAWLRDKNDIVQIKGKQNRAPSAEYLPYVQDFVKSGKWGEVGDLGNTGLAKHPLTGEFVSSESAEAFRRMNLNRRD